MHKICHQAVSPKEDEFSEIIKTKLIEIKKINDIGYKGQTIIKND